MATQRVTNEQIVAAYRKTGNVWKAAKELGLCGQSVWERLKRIGVPLTAERWKTDEIAELTALAATCTIGEIAQRLGRPYYGVAMQLSKRGLAIRVGSKRKHITRPPLPKRTAYAFARLLPVFRGSLQQFARANGVGLNSLVVALQVHTPDVWKAISVERGLTEKKCPECLEMFYPMSGKQKFCSRKCGADNKRDRDYFGGRRSDAIGLKEGICQLCEREGVAHLAAHHVFGKENDPTNGCLVALCRGCHKIVGMLARITRVTDSSERWEALIALVLARRHEGQPDRRAMHVCVEWEWLTEDDLENLDVA